MTTDYSISYFRRGETYTWAKYVDSREHGGNGNGKVDGKEISLFTQLIEYRYGYKYSFDRLDSEQNEEIRDKKLEYENNPNTTAAKKANMAQKLFFGIAGTLGKDNADELANKHTNHENIAFALERISSCPDKNERAKMIHDYINGYNKQNDKKSGLFTQRQGLFRQLASEEGKGLTNKDVLTFLSAIIESVPENKKNGAEYNFLRQISQIVQKNNANPNQKFTGIDGVDLKTLDSYMAAVI